ncbi:MAG: nickel-dependent lactate racemase [candidate division WOR-3 bacterium]|nr:nickel-dependent lactate racemase [candidate division WOR-3 bacterium]MCX7836989.1 nickel-dependent lactate racemase [candidate division WOR-3 bacterium]MDW8114067.1 nickel-dependent lactate racemase [candidate division WOR-3 bacterium]
MEYEISYGKIKEKIEIPNNIKFDILKPINPPKVNLELIIPKLKEECYQFFSSGNSFLIIVNDYTRPTPTSQIISFIEECFSNKEIYFLVALGSHRKPDEKENFKIFGNYYEKYKNRIFYHNYKEKEDLIYLGKTSFNTPIYLNKLIEKVDKIITINSIEPHYFAGYTGGRKTFLPGIAGYETITANHFLSLNKKADLLSLKNNPVSCDMEEVAKRVEKPIFSIQVIVDQNKKIHSLTFGNLFSSFGEGIELANKVFCIPIKEKYDLVIALIQPPYDVNFYQAQKGLENAKMALKEKGKIILASACEKGIGEEEFIEIMKQAISPKEIIEKIKKNFVLGYQKSAKLAELLTWAEIYTAVNIPDSVVESIFMKPFKTVNEAFNYAIKNNNIKNVLLIPDASLMLPTLTK